MAVSVGSCPDHEGCSVHTAGNWPSEPGSWRSHWTADLDDATRLNLDAPTASRLDGTEVKWRLPTATERAMHPLGDDPDEHAFLGAAAGARFLAANADMAPIVGQPQAHLDAAGATLLDACTGTPQQQDVAVAVARKQAIGLSP